MTASPLPLHSSAAKVSKGVVEEDAGLPKLTKGEGHGVPRVATRHSPRRVRGMGCHVSPRVTRQELSMTKDCNQ